MPDRRRRFGQHFLTDARVVERIFAALGLDADDHVVEIGPGTGVLTERLCKEAGSVVAVEIDRELAGSLRQHLAGVEVVSGDALAVDLAALLDRAGPRRRRIVGNLPYNIATPLLDRLFEPPVAAADMHFMVQAEVARRLSAAPHSKAYGRLSVVAQWQCRVETLFEVSAGSFSPPPKVRSAFVRLVPRADERLSCDPAALRLVLRVAFCQAPKNPRQCLRIRRRRLGRIADRCAGAAGELERGGFRRHRERGSVPTPRRATWMDEAPRAMRKFEVSAEPRYILAESDPANARFVFAYTITIANRGDEPAQLLNRYWLITNGDGKREEVRGPGVVGNQPRIAPGQAFRYTSACVLETAVGSMQGHYEFATDAGERFEVPIATFSLAVPGSVH